MTVIEFAHVSKTYSRHKSRQFLRSALGQFFGRRREGLFYALKDVSFQVERGESLAVVGPNGAGKSTLLSLVAGLSWPEEGKITVGGRIAALLELGAGFHPDLTGIENIHVNAALLGLKRKEVQTRFDDIVEFSGLREFIDEPLRTYSAGMSMRLAFSVAVNVVPDILLIDEILAVGDQNFQAKCIDHLFKLKEQGTTLLCVSHGSTLLKRLCDHALWLDTGRLMRLGPAREVIEEYEQGAAAAAH